MVRSATAQSPLDASILPVNPPGIHQRRGVEDPPAQITPAFVAREREMDREIRRQNPAYRGTFTSPFDAYQPPARILPANPPRDATILPVDPPGRRPENPPAVLTREFVAREREIDREIRRQNPAYRGTFTSPFDDEYQPPAVGRRPDQGRILPVDPPRDATILPAGRSS